MKKCREIAEKLAGIAEQIPDDEAVDNQMSRAILFLTAGIMDQATEDELTSFVMFIQHFGAGHCARLAESEKSKKTIN